MSSEKGFYTGRKVQVVVGRGTDTTFVPIVEIKRYGEWEMS